MAHMLNTAKSGSVYELYIFMDGLTDLAYYIVFSYPCAFALLTIQLCPSFDIDGCPYISIALILCAYIDIQPRKKYTRKNQSAAATLSSAAESSTANEHDYVQTSAPPITPESKPVSTNQPGLPPPQSAPFQSSFPFSFTNEFFLADGTVSS